MQEPPNYLKSTTVLKCRTLTRNVQNTLTEAQRTLLAEELEAKHRRRPSMPKILNAEERLANRDVLKRMETKVTFLKNPRYQADRQAADRGHPCPFAISPAQCVFRNYEVGGVYEIEVEFRNTTNVGRRLRVLPCANEMFSVSPLIFEAEEQRAGHMDPSGIVAPGLSARVTLRFAPTTLNDQTEQLVLSTEFGDYKYPVQARRVQPLLDFQEPVDCGCVLAGHSTTKLLRITNRGGEGSFRLVPKPAEDDEEDIDEADDFHYESDPEVNDVVTFVSPAFRVAPAAFFLDAHESIDLKVYFDATEVKQHKYGMFIECDNGELTVLTLVAVTEAVRLELLGWPTLPAQLRPHSPEGLQSPWMLMPWQLRWMQPGTQAGCSSSQEIVISNGGFLPMQLSWHFVEVPKSLFGEKQLPPSALHLLNNEIMAAVHRFKPLDPRVCGMEDCPFTVAPQKLTLQPFSTATFTFSFFAVTPVGKRVSVFAYMAVNELPQSRHCLLPLKKLLSLQKTMQPDGYNRGLPLFGAAESTLVDKVGDAIDTSIPLSTTDESASCVAQTLLLQAVASAPQVMCFPPVLALSGDVAPFVAHTRELRLKNTGRMPVCFRVRLTCRAPPQGSDVYDPLWVVGAGEVGSMPHQLLARTTGLITEDEQMRMRAEQLAVEWPPLAPEGESCVTMPGFGSLGTAAVEPDEGQIQPGETLVLRVTLRIARESDLDGQLLIDLPATMGSKGTVVKPISVRVFATARSPRLHLRGTSALDYGVVCAHAQHTQKLQVENPSDLPALVRLRHYNEDGSASNAHAEKVADEELFPFESHQEVVQTFVECVRQGLPDGFIPIDEGFQEAQIKPWVNARSGCLDKSGRRKYRYRGRRLSRSGEEEPPVFEEEEGKYISDDADFVFHPSLMVLGPRQRVEVSITLRTRAVQKYRTLIEVRGFDSHHSECIDVVADVQLPRLHLSSQHVHFAPTYVKAASQPTTIKLWNDSDMQAGFNLDVPIRLEAGLEVQVDKTQGVVPPHGNLDLNVLVVPTRVAECAELMCRLFTTDLIQPLELKITAKVFGLEVDYAVLAPDVVHPVIEHLPREMFQLPSAVEGDNSSSCSSSSTFPVLAGVADVKESSYLDFGQLPLQTTRDLQVVLYNRSGIATPFSAKIDRHPAYDPFTKGKTISGVIDACTRMYSMVNSTGGQKEDVQSFANQPRASLYGSIVDSEGESSSLLPARSASLSASRSGSRTGGGAGGGVTLRRGNSRFEPKSRTQARDPARRPWGAKRKFLLDDKHERQGFQSKAGIESMKQKDLKEQSLVALKHGHGWAIKVEPPSDWLQPFGKAIITCTCYSDLPGPMEDQLILTVRQLEAHSNADFRIPIKVFSVGSPLYLPGQQTGLDLMQEPPRLKCGTITPLERATTRRFKVANNSATQVVLSWKIFRQTRPETPMPKAASSPEPSGVCIEEEEEDGKEQGDGDPEGANQPEGTEQEGADKHTTDEEEQRLKQEEEQRIMREAEEAEKEKQEQAKKKKDKPGTEKTPKKKEQKRGKDEPSASPTPPPPADSPEPESSKPADAAEELQEEAIGVAAAEGDLGSKEQEDAADEALAGNDSAVVGAELAEEGEGGDEIDTFALPSGDVPMRIDPEEAILPVQGTATFTVTMLASKATAKPGRHYFYRLLGKGRCRDGVPNGRLKDSSTAKPATPEANLHTGMPVPPVPLPKQVEDLPKIPLVDEALHDDDSDIEQIPDARPTPQNRIEERQLEPSASPGDTSEINNDGDGQMGKVLEADAEKDVVATILLDCYGDCILPRLTIDKKDDEQAEDVPVLVDADVRRPEDEEQLYSKVFKFLHSSIPPDSQSKALRVCGATHAATLGGSQLPGVAQNLVRQITFANHNDCLVTCCFRTKGPFSLRQISLVGQKPARQLNLDVQKMKIRGEAIPEDPLSKHFTIPAHEAITVQVAFVPGLVNGNDWTDAPEQSFKGLLMVEYPKDISHVADPNGLLRMVTSNSHLQHVHLLAISRRPSVKVTLVPDPMFDLPSPSSSSLLAMAAGASPALPTVMIEFGRSHIQSSVARKRIFLLSNSTNVIAKWRLIHVGRKSKASPTFQGEASQNMTVDDRDVFVFDMTEGELAGPSREGRQGDSATWMPHYYPTTPALPTAMAHFDSWKLDPARVTVAFKPKKAQQYQSKFRIQVAAGQSVDFICRGLGSFDEEDDIMELREA